MAGEVQLNDVAEIIMGQSPPGSTYNESGVGLPFFQGVRDFNYRHPSIRVFCSEPTRIALPGDILFSVRAPIGRVNIAEVECSIGRGLSIIRARSHADRKFIEFALRNMEQQWQVIEGGGSVFGNATRRDLATLSLPWPGNPLEREAIGYLLGALDDKIELNRTMNRTLEATARAIFKSWFVDFDPVHWNSARRLANIPRSEPGKWFIYAIECEGGSHYIGFTDDLHRRFDEHCRGCGADWTKAHPPVRLAYWEPVDSQAEAVAREQKLKSGSGREWLKAEIARNWTPRRPLPAGRQVKPEIAALFPDTFEPSELGEIPKGWSVGMVGDIAMQAIGGQWGADGPTVGVTPAVCLRGCDMEDLRQHGAAPSAPVRYIKPKAIESRLPCKNDLLIAASGAGPCGRPLWCAPEIAELFDVPVIYSNFVKRFSTPSSGHAIYLDRILIQKFEDRSIGDFINGTSVPNLDAPGLLSGCRILLPPPDVVETFARFCLPMYARLYSKENITLAALRDTLLPKLISGELRVPDAERIAGRCL